MSDTQPRRAWKWGDYVAVTLRTKGEKGKPGFEYKEHLVAADNPNSSEKPWIVVANANDWNRVGQFEFTDTIESRRHELLWSEDGDVGVPQDPAMSGLTPRAELLREAEKLIVGDRNETYGAPTQNFSNIAAMWNVQFAHMLKDGVTFSAAHVAQAQIGTKLCRMIAQPKRDNYLDIAGYAACGWETEAAS